MQAIPRFFSVEQDGESNEREFLRDYLHTSGELCSRIFLKGYQWPFDARRVTEGSSLLDVLVYIETEIKGRRVYLDYRRNPKDFAFDELSREAEEYLRRSDALGGTPIERLRKMNPSAIELYRDHGIDISKEPLEIAVCAQHNNGGLAGNVWWESTNIAHLFPIGEVNGSHGAYRPGGSALNAGQVGGFRAAEFIANRYREWTAYESEVKNSLSLVVARIKKYLHCCRSAEVAWQRERDEFQSRMSRAGAQIRSVHRLDESVEEAWVQYRRLESLGCTFEDSAGKIEALRNRHLCFSHAVYLEAIQYALSSGVGSRGSSLVLDEEGILVHEALGDSWRFKPEDVTFRERVLETVADPSGGVGNEWVPRRPLPRSEAWFETDWARFRRGDIYD